MSRVFICLSVLFILSVAVRFGNCENNTIQPQCDGNIIPGSEKTRLSRLERFVKRLKQSIETPLKIGEKIFGKSKNDSQSKGTFGSILEKYKDKVHFIFPGTLWCGDGDIARNEQDLGYFNKTDACCRDHDNCKNDIPAGETEVNLINNGIFTRSAFACDDRFYKCLKDVNRPVAFKIGVTYFNILRQQCFRCICPTDDCDRETDETECKGNCKKYEWIDSPKFISIV